VKLGERVRLSRFINLYGCEIGDDTGIGAFVEIQRKRGWAAAARCPAIHSYVKVWLSKTKYLSDTE
jgi:hypothetical protein